jgi:hypothetical protein
MAGGALPLIAHAEGLYDKPSENEISGALSDFVLQDGRPGALLTRHVLPRRNLSLHLTTWFPVNNW